MNWSQFKLGVGPMSSTVVDACLKYSYAHDFPLMFIASRNQVDYDTGYAFRTKSLVDFIKNSKFYNKDRIKICRDHCGPNFSEKDASLDYYNQVESCKKTITTDLENGFDLIHIDVSRVDAEKQANLAECLIEHALQIDKNIALEFGSEDNTGQNLSDSLAVVDSHINFASNYSKNIKFIVNQTGSLTKHTQVGVFNSELSKRISDKLHKYGFLFKEHNADYLTKSQVATHKNSGVDSINIAPQLGYTHTHVLSRLSYHFEKEFEYFKAYVLEQGMWKKWVVDSVRDDETKFLVSAHYFFNSEYSMLINDMLKKKKLPFEEMIYDELSIVLDQYRLGYLENDIR